ncbi:MAG: hypothetical protein F4Y99_00150 [Acidimicrobiaceae bacterium]|nr:hypothetical protein [Acidimicrobiaceae bacterium]MCY3650715.1 hypothetical protein [Acidimicrobiaceae bacterium]MDE0516197.1 hypothetical protein [Acidimicrobiaceae bacterium]MDE0655794.1 hypothetical protein [Acidimicrobiaceae bacterium]MXZ94328.1 hypothetical protein [Acidimicrobiaceae bacterium]
MDSPVAKIIMLAATIAITVAVVAFTWQVVGNNTPDPTADPATDKAQIKHENLCKAVGGKWTTTPDKCS